MTGCLAQQMVMRGPVILRCLALIDRLLHETLLNVLASMHSLAPIVFRWERVSVIARYYWSRA